MSRFSIAFNYERVKLFRRSNVLFVFLMVYLYLTPFSVSLREIEINSSPLFVFETIMNNLSIMSLLIMSLFFVNSVGNDFAEGSYRKSIAIGLSKKNYMLGKLMLVLIASLIIFLFNFSIFLLVATLKADLGLMYVLNSVSLVVPIFQVLSLFCAALFGLSFIVLFRNRVIGLVFFPFWLSIEFVIRGFDVKKNVFPYSDYFPGNAAYNLYNLNNFDFKSLIIVILLCFVFITFIWAGLEYREEKGNMLQ